MGDNRLINPASWVSFGLVMVVNICAVLFGGPLGDWPQRLLSLSSVFVGSHDELYASAPTLVLMYSWVVLLAATFMLSVLVGEVVRCNKRAGVRW